MNVSYQKTYRESVYPVPHVPLRIDEAEPLDGVRQLLNNIRPEWPIESVKFKVARAFSRSIMVSGWSEMSMDSENFLSLMFSIR